MEIKRDRYLKNSIFLLRCSALVKYTDELHDKDFPHERFVFILFR